MTRRELLKTAGVFTTMPIIFPNIVSSNIINFPMVATGLSHIKHFNDGREIDFTVRFNPSDHNDGKAYLNLINLPVNEFCNTVLVIKLLFKKSLDNLRLPNSPFDGIV